MYFVNFLAYLSPLTLLELPLLAHLLTTLSPTYVTYVEFELGELRFEIHEVIDKIQTIGLMALHFTISSL